MLSTIDLNNFRGFSRLKLEGLGLVNLVVGRNNTGKTSLLEALAILADPNLVEGMPGLFRTSADRDPKRYFDWIVRDGPLSQAELTGIEGGSSRGRVVVLRSTSRPQTESWPPVVTGRISSGNVEIGTTDSSRLSFRAISVQHRASNAIALSFAEAVRSATGEAQMESLLRAVDSRVRTIRLDYQEGTSPFIVLDLGLTRRVPVSQAGDGMGRLIAVFSELLGHKPNICFIDEIENGIHYSVLPQVWKGLAEVAEQLQTQIFATTHSGECLAAAHEAFVNRPTYDLRVLQLYRNNGCVEGRVLDRDLIQAGLDGDIDLR